VLLLTAAGAALAPLGIRVAAGGRGGLMHAGLALALAGGVAVAAAASLVMLRRADPAAHAYDAVLWVMAGYVLFHAVLLIWMTLFFFARRFLGEGKPGETLIVRLWADYLAITAILGIGAIHLPGAMS
jgi:cytochrome c oxidase subunit I+III